MDVIVQLFVTEKCITPKKKAAKTTLFGSKH
jgi:hypothetical protein